MLVGYRPPRGRREPLLRVRELPLVRQRPGQRRFQKIYDIVHPAEQYQSARELRTSPFYEKQADLDAEFFEAAGWERPQWYESNSDLLDRYEDELAEFRRPNEWDSRWWSPVILAEHLHTREHVSMIGDMGFSIFDFRGSDVVDYLERMAVGRIDVDVGKTVYTPILAENGGFVSDLTIARLGPKHYRVVTGGAAGGSDRAWFGGHIPDDADVTMIDRSESLCTLGVWGPNARDMVEGVTEEDMSHDAFEPYTAQEITVGEVDAWAMRLSYIGEQGWEIYAPMGQGRRLWDVLWEAGQDHNIRPAGMGVYGTTGRLEKGYRLFGHELELEYNPAEAGLTFHGVKDADFIGKEATQRLSTRRIRPRYVRCPLTTTRQRAASAASCSGTNRSSMRTGTFWSTTRVVGRTSPAPGPARALASTSSWRTSRSPTPRKGRAPGRVHGPAVSGDRRGRREPAPVQPGERAHQELAQPVNRLQSNDGDTTWTP